MMRFRPLFGLFKCGYATTRRVAALVPMPSSPVCGPAQVSAEAPLLAARAAALCYDIDLTLPFMTQEVSRSRDNPLPDISMSDLDIYGHG